MIYHHKWEPYWDLYQLLREGNTWAEQHREDFRELLLQMGFRERSSRDEFYDREDGVMEKIEVDAGLFEMILKSLANQKYTPEMGEDEREEAQRVIDDNWNLGMALLRNYHSRKDSDNIKAKMSGSDRNVVRKHLDDAKSKMSEPARRAVEARESFEEGGPRVVADMDWTVEQRKEIMVILGGLSSALERSKEIADPGYREWARCGMYNKCAQLIELKVAEWDKSGGSRCLKGGVRR